MKNRYHSQIVICLIYQTYIGFFHCKSAIQYDCIVYKPVYMPRELCGKKIVIAQSFRILFLMLDGLSSLGIHLVTKQVISKLGYAVLHMLSMVVII